MSDAALGVLRSASARLLAIGTCTAFPLIDNTYMPIGIVRGSTRGAHAGQGKRDSGEKRGDGSCARGQVDRARAVDDAHECLRRPEAEATRHEHLLARSPPLILEALDFLSVYGPLTAHYFHTP